MSARSRVGVTLVEVFIALVIIAFVAAVLFPIFQNVERPPRRGSCLSNMKQLSLAYIEYEQDSVGDFPSGVNATGNGWAGQLYPYTRSTGVYHCPDDSQEGKFISYAENMNLVKQNYHSLAKPAATVELYEFTTRNCDPETAETVSATSLSAPQDSKRHDQPDFPNALNFAFTDGHVKYLTPQKVSGGPIAVRAKTLPQGAIVGTFAIK